MIVVPDACLDLLMLHRTDYKVLTPETIEIAHYLDLVAAFESFRPYLPSRDGPLRILDIGAGLGGIDVMLRRHYGIRAELTLADRNARTAGPQGGFQRKAGEFAAYCDFDRTREFLKANDVEERIEFVDLEREPLPAERFDLVVSLLSWGFHYPVDTYAPDSSLLVLDVRGGTPGILTLNQRGYHAIQCHQAKRHRRIVAWREG